MQKSCSQCLKEAQYSVVAIISSVGVSARLQKSSSVVLFCDDCMHMLCERLYSTHLCKAVNSAYTTLNQRFLERATAKGRAQELK